MKIILVLMAVLIAALTAMLLAIPLVEFFTTRDIKPLAFFLALAVIISPILIGLLPPRRIKKDADKAP